MTTCLAVMALSEFSRLVSGAANIEARRRAEKLSEWVLDEQLDDYLTKRWNSRNGEGGQFRRDSQAVSEIAFNYRHTAWLLRLWLMIPQFSERQEVTFDCLCRKAHEFDWGQHNVSTPSASHVAITEAASSLILGERGRSARMERLLGLYQNQAVAKYKAGISGWASGLDDTQGRQPYTLLVLAEMPYVFGTGSELDRLMSQALEVSMTAPWTSGTETGVPRVPGGGQNPGMGALMVSCLLRKPSLTGAEASYLRAKIQDLAAQLSTDPASYPRDTYTWAVSYFVRDVCRTLLRKASHHTPTSQLGGNVPFDVFLAHNSRDREAVARIARQLREAGLRPWLDTEQIRPGRWWQDVIQEALREVKSIAVFIGPAGLGDWESPELRVAVSRCTKERIPVIPVLLPGCERIPDGFPFLQELQAVRFDKSVTEQGSLDLLRWGISGRQDPE